MPKNEEHFGENSVDISGCVNSPLTLLTTCYSLNIVKRKKSTSDCFQRVRLFITYSLYFMYFSYLFIQFSGLLKTSMIAQSLKTHSDACIRTTQITQLSPI